jgi:hypothetical protein
MRAFTSRRPIVDITRVDELYTKPFIHDVNQQGMRAFARSNLCFSGGYLSKEMVETDGIEPTT